MLLTTTTTTTMLIIIIITILNYRMNIHPSKFLPLLPLLIDKKTSFSKVGVSKNAAVAPLGLPFRHPLSASNSPSSFILMLLIIWLPYTNVANIMNLR